MDNSTELEETRKYFNGLSMEERLYFIDGLSPPAYRYLKYCTDVFYWDKQLIPDGDWKYYLMFGGRGSSKTYSLCHEIKKRLMRGDPGLMAVSPSYVDMNDVLVPSILEQFADDYPAVYNQNKKIITAPNGNSISLKSAEQGIIKGRNVTTCFIDELSECWATSDLEKQLNYFAILDGNIRRGNAQMIISSNPETTPIFRHLWDMHLADKESVKIIHSSIHENPYLDPKKKEIYVKQWAGTRYEKMQLLGILDWSQDGALWSMELINATRCQSKLTNATLYDHVNHIANPNPAQMAYRNPFSYFWRFVIAIDPAMSVSEKSDETGIIIAAQSIDDHIYILEDLSGKWQPDEMAEIVQQARQRYNYLEVVVETNQGGFFVTNALKTKDPYIDSMIRPIKVSDSKMTRAQHIVILWDHKSAHIVGHMPKLEQQMIYYTGQSNQKSPDRFDAMAMACHQLAFEPALSTNMPNLPRF